MQKLIYASLNAQGKFQNAVVKWRIHKLPKQKSETFLEAEVLWGDFSISTVKCNSNKNYKGL